MPGRDPGMLQNGIDVNDSESVAANADRPRISIGTDPQVPTIALDGVDVSARSGPAGHRRREFSVGGACGTQSRWLHCRGNARTTPQTPAWD